MADGDSSCRVTVVYCMQYSSICSKSQKQLVNVVFSRHHSDRRKLRWKCKSQWQMGKHPQRQETGQQMKKRNPNDFYSVFIHTGILKSTAANSRCRPLSGSGTDDNNNIVSMSKCIRLCRLIYRPSPPSPPAPAIEAQHFVLDFNAAYAV